jgi:ribosomal protein L24
MYYLEKDKKATKIKVEVKKDGKKVRVSKKTNEEIK